MIPLRRLFPTVCRAAVPLALVLSLGCDEPEEEDRSDDEVNIVDVLEDWSESDDEEEYDPYDDECGFFENCARRATAFELAGLIGLPEEEMLILLDDAGYEPELAGDRMLYTVHSEDIDELALLSATE